MSDQKDKTPYRHGRDKDEGYDPSPTPYGKDKDEGHEPPPYGRGRDQGHEPPPRYGRGGDEGCEPPPPPCPDPCDQYPPWGPPDIRPECCPDDRQCCPEGQHSRCTWDEVTDPCVRASSCVGDWTKVHCKCHSSNEECDCKEWDCRCYPQGGCVPCKPCEEVFPDPVDECSDPPREDCTTTDLRLQLDALQRCISSQKGEKQKIDAEIAAREAREGELKTLIDGFDKIVTTYKAKRQDLICTEDCLKGFYRDVTRVFKDKYKFPERCLKEMRDAINGELCTVEKEKCCYNNLVGKLEKVTKLIWVRDEAKRRWEKADSAFKDLQRFDAWIGEQFALLEKWKKEINDKLISNDPNDHKKAFYIFYWKFAPAFCNRFAVAFCCEKKESEHPDRSGEQRHSEGHPTYHIGCEPGDWHPSVITVEKLTKLICCAWDYVHELKQAYHDANDRVVAIEHNRDYVALRITAHDEKVIDQNITNLLNAVDCKAAPCAD